MASRPTRPLFFAFSLQPALALGPLLFSGFYFRFFDSLGPVALGRGSKRFSGKAFPWTVAPFSSIRFSFRETVAGLFGCAVERSGAKSHVAEFLAIAGACGMVSR